MKFEYRAIKDNQVVKGEIEAKNRDKAIELLKSNRVSILDVKQKSKPLFEGTVFNRVSFNEIVNLTRHLAIMLNSGLTIVDAIDIVKKQSTSTGLKKLVNSIDDEVKAGNSLSSALEPHSSNFSNFYIALVKAGEASGKLDNVLNKLADNLEKERAFKGKIKGALIYPAIIIVVMIAVIFIMITFVVPNLLGVYNNFDIELPPQTQILIALSGFFSSFWWLILIGVGGFVHVFRKYAATKAGKKSIDIVLLKVPIISKVISIAALVDTTRTLSILVQSGVSLLDSLDIITETTTNVVYQEALAGLRDGVEKGDSLWATMERQSVFPPILVQMTRVGEQTGKLDETLEHLSKYFEAESELAVKALTTMIEPAVLVILGVTVGFVVFAIITPIFNLTTAF